MAKKKGKKKDARGRKGLAAELKRMLRAVPKQGTISNAKLRKKLGWQEATFWRRRDELVATGQLGTGRGRGGTVYRIDAQAAKDGAKEKDYYDDLAHALAAEWEGEYQESRVEVTAFAGRKQTGGRWTRPDLTLVGMSAGKVIPPYVFIDVHTFEVKRVQDTNVTAVHEALQHSAAATHAWVLVVVPSASHRKNRDFEKRVDRVAVEAAKHGMGLALWQPKGRPRWDYRVKATRNEPDPRMMDAFLAGQLEQGTLDWIGEWFEEEEEEEEAEEAEAE